MSSNAQKRYQGHEGNSAKKRFQPQGRLTITVSGVGQQPAITQPLSFSLEEGEIAPHSKHDLEEGELPASPRRNVAITGASRRKARRNQKKHKLSMQQQTPAAQANPKVTVSQVTCAPEDKQLSTFKQWAQRQSAQAFSKKPNKQHQKRSWKNERFPHPQRKAQPSAYAVGRAKQFGLEGHPQIVAAMDKPVDAKKYKRVSALRKLPEAEAKHPLEDAAMLNWLRKSLLLAGVHDLDTDPDLTAQVANDLSRAPQQFKDKLAEKYAEYH